MGPLLCSLQQKVRGSARARKGTRQKTPTWQGVVRGSRGGRTRTRRKKSTGWAWVGEGRRSKKEKMKGSWGKALGGGGRPEETNMDPGRASPTEREAELAEGMETEQAEEPGPAMLPPRRPAPLAPPRPLPRHGDPGGAGGAAGLRRDGPYQFINRYSEQTLRELQYIKLMLDLNIGPTQAEKILAYFKALHPSTLQRMPATYAALTRRYAAPTGMVRLQVKDVPVPQDARDYLGVRCPETLAFP